MDDLRCNDISALGAPAVKIVATEKFGFRPEMVLRQCLGIRLEFARWNWLAGFAIKCGLSRLADIPIEGGNRLRVRLLPRSSSFWFRPLLGVRQFELRPSMKCTQEIERLHLVRVFAAGIEGFKPF